jgi:glutamyl/glutaminyl-tRNA synthetase
MVSELPAQPVQAEKGGVGRFAPSTTGPAHPGTLLAALLCWLDARSRGARVVLRLEDLDPDRCREEFATAMIDDLAWLGLEWDAVERQSDFHARHSAALDRCAELGVLYPSAISRKKLEALGRRAPDGGWTYDNHERGTPLPVGGWRASTDPLRVKLPAGIFTPRDAGGLDLAQDPSVEFGDPVVRRRDGAIAYHLAAVVDDAAIGVTHVVRGRDIATSTATQVALQQVLGLPTPTYRHHFLLLERQQQKLAKFHGSVGAAVLRQHYSAAELCGWLAAVAGLTRKPTACSPADLLPHFSWERVRSDDVLVHWNGKNLEVPNG